MDEMKDYLDDNLCVPVPENGAATTLDADFPPPSEDGEDVGEGMAGGAGDDFDLRWMFLWV